jgi:hypothetical protein
MSAPAKPPHAWRFFRSGGLDQALLETADDLRSLAELDQKLWVALSCPVKGLQVDERTLSLIDTDGDGHVRPPEIISAVSWACARLKDPAALLPGADALPVDAIGDAAVADAARWILSRLGKPGESVSAADAAGVATALAKGPLKGDGILRPEAGPDEATQALIRDIAACCGEATEPAVAAFYSDLSAFKAWSEAGGSAAAAGLGPAAAEAFEAVAAVRAKVADYFARTALAAFDPAAAAGLNRQEEDFRAVAGGELAADSPVLAAFPLARIEANRPLPLLEGVNPAWSAALARLHGAAVAPLLGAGKSSLTPSDWAALGERLRPYESWVGTRPTSPVARLGLERIEAILAGPGRKALADLFGEDRLLAPRVGAAADVERLALFHRDLGTILRNFVNFSDFYSRSKSAIFQAGTLYLDSRSCRLCIQVDDFAAHSVFADMSRVYIAYAECRRQGGQSMKLAAAFTQGDSDYLFVGRNGVFYDRGGRDWDATIVKISDTPMSIRQSFLTPYKKVAAFVGGAVRQVCRGQGQGGARGQPDHGGGHRRRRRRHAPRPLLRHREVRRHLRRPRPRDRRHRRGHRKHLQRPHEGMPPWMTGRSPSLAALLIISGPSMLLAALKLRQRNLGPLLEGTGWAVNGRVKINMPLGTALTDRGVLPPNASA